jgi:hypothetical protein
MKTNTAHQEVLLMTGTSFSLRLWCDKDENGNQKNSSPEERLKEACWNGVLPEMLPEICKPFIGEKKLFLWQVKEANSIIELDLAEVPGETDKYFSINPYSFLQTQFFS